MSAFFRTGKLGKSNGASNPAINTSPSKKQSTVPLSPIEQFIHDRIGPEQHDGTDKFFGMHNPSNTCYFNSVMQCLFHSEPFREHVLHFPVRLSPEKAKALGANSSKPVVEAMGANDVSGPLTSATARAVNEIWGTPKPKPGQPALPGQRPEENKDSFDYQKKQAMNVGPFLTVDKGSDGEYGMPESMFTTIKDMFEAMVAHEARNGIVTPVKSLEILKSKHDVFRSNLHQDAHEFLNILLNEIVEEVEEFSKKHAADAAVEPSWVHSLFEGTLTSETRCLACENVSQRDEVFLDLSVDLEEHTSVTSCLQKFSEEEMLCERNKFHCDKCGGLQEAEKRMKVKRLPKILALHLKRFKYVEEADQMQKLFHRVVYPFHLRLLNTTDDAEDPDKLYELYAIIVHLGSTPFHGHYVAIVKTKHGWALLDDELVLPVDKEYVRNFFGGGNRHPACAYVLFYQETTAEAVQAEQNPEDLFDADVLTIDPDLSDSQILAADVPNSPTAATPATPLADLDPFLSLGQVASTPIDDNSVSAQHLLSTSAPGIVQGVLPSRMVSETDAVPVPPTPDAQSKSVAAKSSLRSGSFRALRHSSLSFRKRPNIFASKDKSESAVEEAATEAVADGIGPGASDADKSPAVVSPSAEVKKSRFGLGRKKSAMLS